MRGHPFMKALATMLAGILLLTGATVSAAPSSPPAAAAQENKLILDPIPAETLDSQVQLSGKVRGRYDMEAVNGAQTVAFRANGWFSVTVNLHMGPNEIILRGTNPAGHRISETVRITRKSVAVRLVLSAPGALVANNVSETTLTATAVDAAGNPVPDYQGNVIFSSSNPAAVQVLGSELPVVNGLATVTLRAGSVAAPAEISASAPGLEGARVTVTPEAQKVSGITMTADPTVLAADGGRSRGYLTLTALDQTGHKMLALPAPIAMELTSSNAAAVMPLEPYISLTQPQAETMLQGQFVPGTATIKGSARDVDGGAIPVQSIEVHAAIVGTGYQLRIDPVAAVGAGTQGTVVVRVLDYNGNQITSPNYNLSVTLDLVRPDGTVETVAQTAPQYGRAVIDVPALPSGSYTLRATGKNYIYDLVPAETIYTVQ